MAIPPSTGDTRGRSSVSKPLSASDHTRNELHANDNNEESSSPKKNEDNLPAGEETPLAQTNSSERLSPSPISECPKSYFDDTSRTELHSNAVNKESPPPKENEEDSPAEKLPQTESERSPLSVTSHESESVDINSDTDFWNHMTATLEACFNTSKDFATNELHTVSGGDVLGDAPRIIQTFLSHGEACAKIEAEALGLVSNGATAGEEDETLKACHEMHSDLERLQETATSLELTISRLAGMNTDANQSQEQPGAVESGADSEEPAKSKLKAHSELRRLFAACLPVLHLRIANLNMAQDLIDSAQENLSISLKMQYLGIE